MTKASGEHSTDAQVGTGLLGEEDGPRQVLGDSAYGSGEARAELAEAGHEAIIKPAPLPTAVPGGFSIDDFTINAAETEVTCPNNITRKVTAKRTVTFGVALQRVSAARAVHHQPQRADPDPAPAGTVAASRPPPSRNLQFQQAYRQHRPMVERSIAWLVRGNRKVRYRGTTKTITGCTCAPPP